MRIAFGAGSYRSESLPVSAQDIVNSYLEESPPQSKTPVAIPRSAGLKAFADLGSTGEVHGAIVHKKKLYAVHGNALHRIETNGTATEIGDIPAAERVGMSVNSGGQLAISSGGNLYVYESALTQVSDPDFPAVSWISHLDGYTIFGIPESGRFGITAINDSTSHDALDFATAEAAPTNTIAGIVDHRELFLFSEEDYEVWFNSGNSDFPLERTSSGYGEIGIAGQYALGKKANTIYFLGSDGIAYRLEGYNPVRISAHAVEQAFRKLDTAACKVETWTERGHAFVGYRFPTDFWVYDIGTTLWHRRASYQLLRWRADVIVKAYGKWLVGSNGKFGELDPDIYSEFGEPQIVTVTAPSVSDNGKYIEHDRLELVFETGVGLTTGQGSNPKVMLEWSDDGGRTFPFDRTASLGAMGEHKARVLFTRLTRSRDRVYRYRVSDPVKLWFLYATLNEWD